MLNNKLPATSIFVLVSVISLGRVFHASDIAITPMGRLIQNMYSHPKLEIIIPPKLGPVILPRETKVPISPRAFPLSLTGKISVTIPWLFAIVIAEPIAWIIREKTKKASEPLKPQRKEPIINRTDPHLKTLIFPNMSPSFPKKG